MAKFCPIVNGRVVYLSCKECEEKECKTNSYNPPKEETKEKDCPE
jgi:hypothetical protein